MKFVRLGHVSAGKTVAFAATRLDQDVTWDFLITASSDDNMSLRLAKWDASGGSLAHLGQHKHAHFDADEVAVTTTLDPYRVISIVKDLNGDLELRSWQADFSDDNLFGETTAGPVDRLLAAVEVPANRFMIAVRTKTGRLKVIAFQVGESTITRLGSAWGGMVKELAFAKWLGSRTVTAVQTSNGRMEVQQWGIDDVGNVTLLGTGKATGTVGALAINHEPWWDSTFERVFVTPVTTLHEDLKLIMWRVDAEGPVTRQEPDLTQEGAFTKVASVGLENWNVTAVRRGDGKLGLYAWELVPGIDGKPDSWELDTEWSAGPIEDVAIVGVSKLNHFVTAVRMPSGQFRLILWHLAPP